MRFLPLAPCCLVLTVCLAGCNSGLGTIFSSTSDSPTDSPSTVSGFSLSSSKSSPTPIRFRMVDGNGGEVSLTLLFQMPGGDPIPMTQLGGLENPAMYAASAEGVEHTVMWDFAQEPELPSDGSYVPEVTVWAEVPGSDAVIPGSNASLSGLGNDAPEISQIEAPPFEVSGVVPIGFELADSSGDLVRIKVEFQLDGESEWTLARPAGEDESPEYAFVGLSAPIEGVSANFFWDTNFDLPSQERDVRLRFTPTDVVDESEPIVSDLFRVDNNDQALALLDNGLITISTDTTGGIAIPFTLRDSESDPSRIVFQWRAPGTDFPELPADPEAVFALQESAEGRAQYQLCTRLTTYVGGLPIAVDSTHLQLPELGTSDVIVETKLLEGRQLEIVRSPEKLFQVSADWETNPLNSPVGVVPVGDGIEAVVLDSLGGSDWQLRRVNLATGEVAADLGSGTGAATALALSRDEQAAFVAFTDGSDWHVERLELGTGGKTLDSSGSLDGATGIRGLAALTSGWVALTVGDRVETIDFGSSPAAIRTVISGLDTPWGLAADPHRAGRVLVAEHGADRILSLDVISSVTNAVLHELPDATPESIALGLPAPRGIALARRGVQLLVCTEDARTGRQLRMLNRGSTHDLDDDGLANASVFALQDLPATAGDMLATGNAGLRVLADPSSGSVFAMGGIEQRREILEATNGNNRIELAEALSPELGPQGHGKTWRVPRLGNTYKTSPAGTQHAFPWDSRDRPSAGPVLLRAVAFDSEFGVPSETSLERPLNSPFDMSEQIIEANEFMVTPIAVDYDQDGDLDLVLGEGANSRVFKQTAKGVYDPTPVPLGVDLSLTRPYFVPGCFEEPDESAYHLYIEDLDRDGNPDIVHVNQNSELEIFHGTGPETFVDTPVRLAFPEVAEAYTLFSFQAVDRDGDGDLDLLVSGSGVPLEPPKTDPPTPPVPVIDFIGFFEQTAPGSWLAPTANYSIEGDTDRPRTVTAGDLDADGRVDLVIAVDGEFNNSGGIKVLFQNDMGDFDPAELVSIQPLEGVGPFAGVATDNPMTVRLADLDEDGDLDIICSHHRINGGFQNNIFPVYAGAVSVHYQLTPRVFDDTGLLLQPEGATGLGRQAAGLEIADVNADGRLDVVVQDYLGLNIFFSEGEGEFREDALLVPYAVPVNNDNQNICKVSLNNRTPIVRDLDGDGHLDLAYQVLSTREFVVRHQAGVGMSGFFETPTRFALTSASDSTNGSNDAVVSDLDDDGDLDFGISTGGLGFGAPNDFKIFFQGSPRNFITTPVQLGAAGGPILVQFPQQVDAADLDGNGTRDLIGVANGTNEILVFFQDPPGEYGLPLQIEGGTRVNPVNDFFNSVNSVTVCDLDLNGTLDLVGTQNQFQHLVTYYQTGPGEFGFVRELGSPDDFAEVGEKEQPEARFRRAGVADLDLDGVMEIVTGSTFNALHLYDTDKNGELVTMPELYPDAAGTSMQVLDLDGDGVQEAVTLIGTTPANLIATRLGESGTLETESLLELIIVSGLGSFSLQGDGFQLIDFDLDGDLDLISIGTSSILGSGVVEIREQLAPGVFANVPTLVVPADIATATALYAQDIDGDGQPDLILPRTGFSTGDVSILWGGQ